jgi:CRP/FNR family cyclic AMP-dependent transcriptional regulator
MPAPVFDANDSFVGLLSIPKAKHSLLEKSNLIDATQWADALSFAQIKRLAQYMDVYEVPERAVLFYEGEKTAYFVLIASGIVDVVKFDSLRHPKRIATLGPGKTIGEMSIIDGEPRSASAVTATQATLLVMTADAFARLLEEWPRVGTALIIKIAKLMSQHLRQTSGRLIDHLGS